MADKAVQVTLPPGMTKEEFDKGFASFLKQKVATTARDKAARAATKDLIAKYPEDYKALLAKHQPRT